MNENILSNRYGIEVPTELSKESVLNYKKQLQVAVLEGAIEDHKDLDEAEAVMIQQDDVEHPNIGRVLQEIQRRLEAQTDEMQAFRREVRSEMNNIRGEMNNIRGEMNNIRGEMNRQFDATREEIRLMNYRMFVIENQRLSVSAQSIQVIPFIYGDGPPNTLPRIYNITDIKGMDENHVVMYIRGYYNGSIPRTLLNKKKKLAELVGLSMFKHVFEANTN